MDGFEKQPILSLEEMFQLGIEGSCVNKAEFDFSAISVDYFSGFFKTLPNVIYKKCKNIRFCNCFRNTIEDNPAIVSENDIRKFENSIRNNKPGYPIYLAKIISKVLPKSKLLTSLEFDQIPLSSHCFRIITNAIKRSRLKSIKFSNLKIKDEDFQYFLSKISPYRLENIVIENCQITDKCSEAIQTFLERQPPTREYPVKFADFVLTENEVTTDPTRKTTSEKNQSRDIAIDDQQSENNSSSISLSPEINEDESDNEEIELTQKAETKSPTKKGKKSKQKRKISPKQSKSNNSIEQEFEEVIEIKEQKKIEQKATTNKSKSEIALEKIRKAAKNVKPAASSTDLKTQNKNLKKELNQLLNAIDSALYNEDVYLDGDNADSDLNEIRKNK